MEWSDTSTMSRRLIRRRDDERIETSNKTPGWQGSAGSSDDEMMRGLKQYQNRSHLIAWRLIRRRDDERIETRDSSERVASHSKVLRTLATHGSSDDEMMRVADQTTMRGLKLSWGGNTYAPRGGSFVDETMRR
jgi:hypothetical protein